MMTKHFFGDTAVLLGRSLRHIMRSPDTIITTTIMPIAFMLLFVYVFGGAIHSGSGSYVNYLLPGILLITIAAGISYTAFRLFLDMTSGIFERFQSMPIARSSVLWAHVLTSLVANLISLVVVVLVGMGFRSGAGVLAWLSVAGILILFTLTLTWIAVVPGLSAKSVDGASAFSYPLIFLPFISSAFVPTRTMPGPVRAFADNQPVTSIVNTIRDLFTQHPVSTDIWTALAWCLGILAGQRETGRRPGQRLSAHGRRQHYERPGGERRQQRNGADRGAPGGPGRGHVDDQAGRLVEGERRGRGEQREADREQHGGGGRERGRAAAHHDRHAGDAADRRPRPGPQHWSGHHVVTAWVNPPVPASRSMIAAAASTIVRARMIRERTRPSAPRSSATRTAIAHRASCQPRKNHGDPRQAVTPASLCSVKRANGANSRSTATGAESGRARVRAITRFTQPERSKNSTNAAPGNRTQRPSATPSNGPPSDGTTICPTRTAIRAGGLNAP